MSHIIIRKRLKDDEVLWRYMDLPKFLSLISSKSLWLARTDTFKDKREGVFHEAMRNELDAIYAKLEADGKVSHESQIKNTSDFQYFLIDNTYISCWHKNSSENMIMWEIYGQSKNSLAIKTTVTKLENSLDVRKAYKDALEVALDEVEYAEHSQVSSKRNYRQPFFLKRPHFSFEQEVRLYFFAKNTQTRTSSPPGYSLPLDINTLIEGVYVHPDSEEWFLNSIKDLVRKYKINASVERGVYGNT